jgi:hypothetical protein
MTQLSIIGEHAAVVIVVVGMLSFVVVGVVDVVVVVGVVAVVVWNVYSDDNSTFLVVSSSAGETSAGERVDMLYLVLERQM